MKTYKVDFDALNDTGVFDISLVKDPAMEGKFIALSKQEEIQLKVVDEEKRIVCGLVLEPNKKIYRFDEDTKEEYYIEFDEKTVEALCYGFTKNQQNNNSSIEHAQKIEGVTFFQNWLVKDPKQDTALAYGFSNLKRNNWFSIGKITNDVVWEKFVKTGKVQGFSITAKLKLTELNKITMAEEEKSNNTLLQEIKDFLFNKKDPKDEEVQLGSVKTEEGLTLMFDGEAIVLGSPVWYETESGEKVPAPIGDHKLPEQNMVLVVSEEGVAGELKEAVAEEPLAEEPTKENLNEEGAEAPLTPQGALDGIKSLLIKYSEDTDAKFEAFKKELETKLADQKKEQDAKLTELSEEPAKEPLNGNTKQVEMSAPATKKGRIIHSLNN